MDNGKYFLSIYLLLKIVLQNFCQDRLGTYNQILKFKTEGPVSHSFTIVTFVSNCLTVNIFWDFLNTLH